MIAELRTDTELERLIAADWLQEYGTEADWNRLLDQYHSDQALRRRFGEWLLEQGEAKGEGYLALSACGRDCDIIGWADRECPFWARRYSSRCATPHHLPEDWFDAITFYGKSDGCCPQWVINSSATREELEEAAAAAFLLLPEDRRAELLAGRL